MTTVSSDLGRTRPPAPSRGTAASWAATAITAKTAATANAARHVVSVPISDAAGKLATVARKIPELTTASAVLRARSLTRLIAAPAPNTQNPPTHTPSTARAASITPKPGARPAITSETTTSALRPTSSLRRSSRAEHRASSGAATAAATAGTTTISPPVPTEHAQVPADVREQPHRDQLREHQRERPQRDGDHRGPRVALPGPRPRADPAGQLRRRHPVNHGAAARGGHRARRCGDPAAPGGEAAGPRFPRSRSRFVMSRLPVAGGHASRPRRAGHLLPATYVIYHVTVNMTCHVIIAREGCAPGCLAARRPAWARQAGRPVTVPGAGEDARPRLAGRRRERAPLPG